MSYQMNTSNTATNPAYKNLELYIPRVSLRITEEQVRDTLFRSQIGIVEYCDIVVTKDKETKQPTYASVFLKLDSWSPTSNARADFEKNGTMCWRQDTNKKVAVCPNFQSELKFLK